MTDGHQGQQRPPGAAAGIRPRQTDETLRRAS